jgi:Uma2 family endonuclease
MMNETVVQKRVFTHDEYFVFMEKMEEVGGTFEFVDGQIVPKEDDVPLDESVVEMVLSDNFDPTLLPKFTVPTQIHDDIISNLLMHLMNRLAPKGFRVYGQKTLFRIEGFRQTREPDIVIVSKNEQRRNAQHEVLNPIVLIEVLSKSTAKTDKTRKATEYQSVESVQEYIIIWQDKVRVVQYRRSTQGKWDEQIFTKPSDTLALVSLDASISLSDIYEDTAGVVPNSP